MASGELRVVPLDGGQIRPLETMIGGPVRVALGIAAFVLIAVVALSFIPVLGLGYPIVLLPLLAAGPLAVRDAASDRRAIVDGALAGALSAILSVAILSFAVVALRDYRWSLVGPLSSPPTPRLPTIAVLPFVSWPQHYILVLNPVLGALAGVISRRLLLAETSPIAGLEARLAAVRASVRSKLLVTFLSLATITTATGWVGFAALEDAHLAGHLYQYQSAWLQRYEVIDAELRQMAIALDGMASPGDARVVIEDASARVLRVTASLRADEPRSGMRHGEGDPGSSSGGYSTKAEPMAEADRPSLGLFVGDDVRRETVEANWAQLAVVERSMERLSALAGQAPAGGGAADRLALLAEVLRARNALSQTRANVQGALAREVNTADLEHHANLYAMLALVAIATVTGLLFGRVAAGAITTPVRVISHHLLHVARADFGQRVSIRNADELGRLADVLNWVTGELDRLYRTERLAREHAEALAAREQEITRAKEFWAHTVVHDLKGPLTAIVAYAELLQMGRFGPLSADQDSTVAAVAERARYLATLAEDIVDTFRLEQTEESLPLAPVEVEALIDEAIQSAPRAEPDAIQRAIAPGLPPLLVDRRLVVRVIANLIVNASKHAGPTTRIVIRASRPALPPTAVPEPSPTRGEGDDISPSPLGASARERRSGGEGEPRRQGPPPPRADRPDADRVQVAVDDDGPGIPVADRERVFQRFTRGETRAPGSGLGLAFCQLAVERHGGRIWVEDAPGGGASFRFTLPVAENRAGG
ncbi:MAG: HAMP domain-containing protein [Chloroflexi bacterium]|nr:HAMP domain-containing protein [Chloroflexota bacterium]